MFRLVLFTRIDCCILKELNCWKRLPGLFCLSKAKLLNKFVGIFSIFCNYTGDKDYADRVEFHEKLPQVQMQLCLYHVIKNFEREITTTKRNITEQQQKKEQWPLL